MARKLRELIAIMAVLLLSLVFYRLFTQSI